MHFFSFHRNGSLLKFLEKNINYIIDVEESMNTKERKHE